LTCGVLVVTESSLFPRKLARIGAANRAIIGENRCFSFADAGLIEGYNTDFLSLKEGRRA